MPIPSDTALFYAVFIAPGFVAIMTIISLAAIEDDYSAFVLLVWSLVGSLVIDTTFLAVYQWLVEPIESFDQVPDILFDPHFQTWYVLGILFASFIIGLATSVFILVDVPGWIRQWLQSWSDIRVNPRQPWANFMRDAGWVRFKTSDDEYFMGKVTEWSRAGRPKQVWIVRPHRYNTDLEEYEEVDVDRSTEMLFLEKDIDRIVMLTRNELPSLHTRLYAWLNEEFTANTET